MGVTKTDFMRGMQCPRMLWLDKHHPDYKVIPPETQTKLDQGNEFGDSLMGIFGSFTEVKEYKPGTTWPDKKRMAKKTADLIETGTQIICEAAFMDEDGNYCAVDILRWNDERSCYDLYEIKNAPDITEQFIRDAGFQAYLIRKTGLNLDRVFLIYHGEEPYVIEDVSDSTDACAEWVAENIGRMGAVRNLKEEPFCLIGAQCANPYDCWYYAYCAKKECLPDRKDL